MEETNRQKKIAGVLQIDLANVLQNMLRETGQKGIISLQIKQVRLLQNLTK
jgi:ribosome-binding factor A